VTKRFVLSYLAVVAAILLLLEIPLGIVYARHERDVVSSGLQHDAGVIAALADESVERGDVAELASLASHYRGVGDHDVEIVASNGKVLVPARSDESELVSGDVGARVNAVLDGAAGANTHLGDGDEIFAVAAIGSATPPVGAVIVTAPAGTVNHRVMEAWIALAILAGGAIAAAMALGLVVARSVTGPLTDLESAAARLGLGDLHARARVRGPVEVRALAGTFNAMAARLEELVTAQQAFVSDASHQLRSPLTAVRLRLENAAADPTAVDAGEIDSVLGEIERLSRIVDGLLLLARSEGERPAREAVDVEAIAAERRDAWADLAEEAGIDLQFSGTGQPVMALWVPGDLEQVLDNLLANAVEATAPGRSVRLVVRIADRCPEVHVIDEGRGMGEDERTHAFDRMWRGAQSRPGAGSGLGLAIVRQLATASGADVVLEVAPGGGVDAAVRCVGTSTDERVANRQPARR
jgi:signal transduction histidine kinase